MRRIAAVLLVGLTLLAACSSDGGGAVTTDVTTPPTEKPGAIIPPPSQNVEPEGVQTFTGLEQTHVDTPVEYPQNPPVGGPHNPQWQTCAFYDKPIMKERGVHSMEHGAVWITYSADLPADQIEILKSLQAGGKEVLVTRYDGLPTPVVASAWGKQLQLESATDARLAQFVSFFDDGPQTPELNTPCDGGTTDTN
jgi:hypothetical protein